MSEHEPATEWSVGVDPKFRSTRLKQSSFVLSTNLVFTPIRWALRNEGPTIARFVQIDFLAEAQHDEESMRWREVVPGETVTFVARKQLLGSNQFRVRWMQSEDTARYWRKFYLPDLSA